MLDGIPLLSIFGKSGTGKTTVAQAFMGEIIGRRYGQIADELRFFYANGPFAITEIKRSTYDRESNYDNVIKHTGMLVLDDFDKIEDRTLAANVVCARADAGKFTVITAISAVPLQAFDERLQRRVQEGRIIKL